MENLSKGLVGVKIHIRGKDHSFNHQDKIFYLRRPISNKHYITKENCQD